MTTEETDIAVIKNQIKTIFDYIKDDKIRKNVYIGIIGGLLAATVIANVYIGRKLEVLEIHIKQAEEYMDKTVKNTNEMMIVKKDIEILKESYHRLDNTQAALIEKTLNIETQIGRGK